MKLAGVVHFRQMRQFMTYYIVTQMSRQEHTSRAKLYDTARRTGTQHAAVGRKLPSQGRPSYGRGKLTRTGQQERYRRMAGQGKKPRVDQRTRNIGITGGGNTIGHHYSIGANITFQGNNLSVAAPRSSGDNFHPGRTRSSSGTQPSRRRS